MGLTTADLLAPVLNGVAALALIAGVAGVIWLVINATAHKVPPVALLLIGFCLESIFVRQPSVRVGLEIYPNDVISIVVLGSCLLGFAFRPLPVTASPFLLWLGFGATIMVSLLIGLNEYGRAAGTEVRPFFYLWVAGLYCCTANFDEADLRRIARWGVWAAYALMGIAAYYWLAVEIGIVNRAEVFDEPERAVFRPVGSHAAFYVAAVAMFQSMAWLRGTGTRFSGFHAAAFVAFVTVIQHRSVWIAAACGLLAVAILERRHLPRRFALMLGFGMTLALLTSMAAGLGYLDDLARRMLESTLSMTDSEGTFAARVDGWSRLLDSWVGATTQTLVFGFPFGHGYTRYYNGQLIEFAPHNYYLDLILRVGIVGAVLMLLPTVMVIAHGLRAKCTSEFEYLLARGLAVALLASLVYFVAYPSYYILGGATGLAMAQMIRQRRIGGWHAPLQTQPSAAVLPLALPPPSAGVHSPG